MKFTLAILCIGLAFAASAAAGPLPAEQRPASLYPPPDQLIASPGHTAYYIDPGRGDDANSGLRASQAWRTFRPVNGRRLAPGDRVQILAPGSFQETLMPRMSP